MRSDICRQSSDFAYSLQRGVSETRTMIDDRIKRSVRAWRVGTKNEVNCYAQSAENRVIQVSSELKPLNLHHRLPLTKVEFSRLIVSVVSP
jgi:hypothetical protein